MSSPFSVASSSAPNLSPSFQIPTSFAHYNNNNSYPNYLAQQSPQFFSQPTQAQQQQQAMPQGQNDLEVLERLKETIKNNQHEYFKPIPQPAALASVYLGPHPSSASSRVPPHPEQLPGGQQSLSGNEHDLSSPSMMIDSTNTGPGTNGSLPPVGDRRVARPQDSWDNGRKQSTPISQTSPQPTTPAPPSRYDSGASSKLGNTKDKSMDVDDSGPPPGLGKQLPASSSTLQRGTLGDTRQGDFASKYDYSTGRSDKPGAGESTSGSANRVTGAQGETTKEDNSRPTRDWPHRNSNASSTMDDPARRSPGPLNNRGPPPSSTLPPSDTRYGDNTSAARDRDSRYYDKDSRDVRDRDRERDRERDAVKPFDSPGRSAWDRDRDRDRDRERDRFDRRPEAGGSAGGRYGRDYDRDRRNDDRFRDARRPPPDQRHYEPKYTSSGGANEGGLRRYDSKSSVGANDPPVSNLNSNNNTSPSRVDDRDRDRVPPSDSRGAPRPLGRDRSIDASRESLDDRRAYPDDRRPPPGPALDRDRTPRPADDRRPPPPTTTRGTLPPADERDRRPTEDPIVGRGGVADQVRPPPADDRRPGHPPRPVSPVPQRSGPPEDHRAPLATRSAGDRRGSVSGGPPPAPARGPPPTAPGDRRSTGPPSGGDDPRRPVPQTQERDAPHKAPAPALPPALEKPRGPVLRERVGFPSSRPSPTIPEDRSSGRPQVPLEDRLARPAPSLQERLSSARADMAHAASDDRPSRPPPKEERPVIPTGPSGREDPRPPPLAKQSDTTRLPPTGPAASEQSTRAIPEARGSASISKSTIPTEPSRPAPVLSSAAPDRGRPPLADRFSARPVTPTQPAAASGPPSRAPLGNYSVGPSASRGNSVPREDFKGYTGTNASPTRKTEYRTASRQPQSYDRDRRSDAMDVDTPPPSATRFPGGDRGQPAPASYRRPSTPPYSRSERTWAPQPGDGYPPEAPRGHPTEPRSYERGWGDDERNVPATYGDEWDRRWDRDRERERERERERDPVRDRDRERDRERERAPAPPPPRDYERDRFVERDSGHPPAWETREERERRAPYGPPDTALPPSTSTSARPYEPRPLSARLTDGYPDDRDRDRDRSRERAYGGRDFERTRYPPDSTSTAPPPFSTSRVRPRSPSPPSRRIGVPPSSSDDLRGPPLKRPREDGYAAGYYPSDPDYTHSRLRTPPPPTSGNGAFYDERGGYTVVSTGHAPLPRDSRDREYDTRDSYGSYDRRRVDTASRMLPPRSPPAYSRPPPSYPRDDGRYMPPPRT
ncbi:hypothetical protein NLI96_g3810 [Meripilus lineatus]|uniref:Uncharacterized protein n=1 Tax=Meripilus lineatus TaxID=2056292 RepID=A0AAD5YKP7_9APHY|nr:hypothetical protein NLI96_g3810 [Physisporinus lineatus]